MYLAALILFLGLWKSGKIEVSGSKALLAVVVFSAVYISQIVLNYKKFKEGEELDKNIGGFIIKLVCKKELF